jgi:hypothetical protein
VVSRHEEEVVDRIDQCLTPASSSGHRRVIGGHWKGVLRWNYVLRDGRRGSGQDWS